MSELLQAQIRADCDKQWRTLGGRRVKTLSPKSSLITLAVFQDPPYEHWNNCPTTPSGPKTLTYLVVAVHATAAVACWSETAVSFALSSWMRRKLTFCFPFPLLPSPNAWNSVLALTEKKNVSLSHNYQEMSHCLPPHSNPGSSLRVSPSKYWLWPPLFSFQALTRLQALTESLGNPVPYKWHLPQRFQHLGYCQNNVWNTRSRGRGCHHWLWKECRAVLPAFILKVSIMRHHRWGC